MKMIQVQDLFEVEYGSNLELNKQIKLLSDDPNSVPYVSRTAKNNGITAYIQPTNAKLNPAHTLSVACGGSVLSTFYQAKPYYSGRDLYFLKPKIKLSVRQMLYYKMCIEANKFRFDYGRQANRTLRLLEIPAPEEIPAWVETIELPQQYTGEAKSDEKVELPPVNEWKEFKYTDLFEMTRGHGGRAQAAKQNPGKNPYIGASAENNGTTFWTSLEPTEAEGAITVSNNGSVGAAFYQDRPFLASSDVSVLRLKDRVLTKQIGLFIITVIGQEKTKYGYGRKWGLSRMKESFIALPATPEGQPDYDLMERYINSLPYSANL